MSAIPFPDRISSWPTHTDRTQRRVPLRVAMLAQQSGLADEYPGTDVMVYRQPASDVPVPCDWRPSRTVAVDPDAPSANAEEPDAIPHADDAPLASTFDSAQLMHEAMSADARLYVWMCSGVVTCTLAAWVTLG
jgi:hypothetical protein